MIGRCLLTRLRLLLRRRARLPREEEIGSHRAEGAGATNGEPRIDLANLGKAIGGVLSLVTDAQRGARQVRIAIRLRVAVGDRAMAVAVIVGDAGLPIAKIDRYAVCGMAKGGMLDEAVDRTIQSLAAPAESGELTERCCRREGGDRSLLRVRRHDVASNRTAEPVRKRRGEHEQQ